MTSAAIAFIISLLCSILIGPRAIKSLKALKLRQTVSEDAPDTHKQKQGTPMMGGIIIIIGFLAGVFAFFQIDSRVTAVLLLALGSALIGFADDYLIATRGKNLGLKARQKLAAQFIIAILFMFWVYASRDPRTTRILMPNGFFIDFGWTYYPLMTLMIVGMSNAFNLADGLDGLASGMTAILALALGGLVLTARDANPALTIMCWSLAGACFGFLWHNCNPAKIFMGDTGSLMLGSATVGIAIAGKCEFFYLVLGAIFVFEALSVIIQVVSFKTRKKRVFKMTPIHHHFELSGMPETRIVVRFWILQVALAVSVLAMAGVFYPWS
ncbi:MAG: phospho-N-acetylmuramoyl-pentapeptide-transferase [Armatimonadota bacterium]